MAELKHAIFGLAMEKAPGAAGILAEIWRHAPRDKNKILLGAVHDLLEGRSMPEHWRGGDIRYLLKTSPANLLKNWRPITLVEITHKIASIIMTKRLQRMAEHYKILEPTQEGFGQGRSTRRQVERLRHILQEQKDLGKQVYIT